jgi:O-antigen ligase
LTAEATLTATRLPDHAASLPDRLESIGIVSLFGVAATVQFSIAAAQLLLAVSILCWAAMLVMRHERVEAPRFFWLLVAYAAATLVSAILSTSPRTSLGDSKQLLLFLIVPVTYRFISSRRANLVLTTVMSLGAASAALGIFQYGLLHYDQLSQRIAGTVGHYMTYSGLLMLGVGIAIARMLFGRGERLWAALVMPALVMAVLLSSTRTAWVGVFAGAALLLMLKDFRLLALLPVFAAIAVAAGGPAVTERLLSTFDSTNATRVDRIAMIREGGRMIRAYPLAGVGPDMVKARYAEFRGPDAVNAVNSHLHNVPVQIAAERGLPALALWLGCMAVLTVDLARGFRRRVDHRFVYAAALAALASMLAAGMFEYNFGDSEFLMLFLLLVTLPFAAVRPAAADARA